MPEFYSYWSRYPTDQLKPNGSFIQWPSFSPKEIACRGTGALLINTPALNALQKLRDALGKPLIINSAYRSPEHNARVGGAKRSKHLEAIAFDVSMANHNPFIFEKVARQCGFNGIGHYAPRGGRYNFMHIDTREHGARWAGGGGWFADNTPTFTPEPEPLPRPAEAALDLAKAGAGTLALEPVIREVAPYLPSPWAERAMIAAIVLPLALGAGFAAYRLIHKRSAEPEE